MANPTVDLLLVRANKGLASDTWFKESIHVTRISFFLLRVKGSWSYSTYVRFMRRPYHDNETPPWSGCRHDCHRSLCTVHIYIWLFECIFWSIRNTSANPCNTSKIHRLVHFLLFVSSWLLLHMQVGLTALALASYNKKPEAVELLLQAGADVKELSMVSYIDEHELQGILNAQQTYIDYCIVACSMFNIKKFYLR